MKKYTDNIRESAEEIPLEVTYTFLFGEDKMLKDYFNKAYLSALESSHSVIVDEIYKYLNEHGFETHETSFDKEHITLTFEKSFIYALTIWVAPTQHDNYRFYLYSYEKGSIVDFKNIFSLNLEPLNGYDKGMGGKLSVKEMLIVLNIHEKTGKF